MSYDRVFCPVFPPRLGFVSESLLILFSSVENNSLCSPCPILILFLPSETHLILRGEDSFRDGSLQPMCGTQPARGRTRRTVGWYQLPEAEVHKAEPEVGNGIYQEVQRVFPLNSKNLHLGPKPRIPEASGPRLRAARGYLRQSWNQHLSLWSPVPVSCFLYCFPVRKLSSAISAAPSGIHGLSHEGDRPSIQTEEGWIYWNIS